MYRPLYIAGLVLAVALVTPMVLRAQSWSPPSRQMPSMPTAADLRGGWAASQGAWFSGVADASAVRGAGSGSNGDRPLQVRFTAGGPVPIAVWSDRNGDGRADMVEVYRRGGVAFQLVDADFDGTANVLREYDAGGGLARESRL